MFIRSKGSYVNPRFGGISVLAAGIVATGLSFILGFSSFSGIGVGDGQVQSGTSGNSSARITALWASSDTFRPVVIPSQSDFTGRGVVLEPGVCGEWDWWFQGPSTVIKHDGTYYLYYIGMDGDRHGGACDDSNGDERNRYLGVATSTDGRTFTKHPANPIIKHQPSGGLESGLSGEGGVAMGASPGVIDGKFILYVGGMEETSYENVDSDIVYYESTDGISYSNQSDAGDHRRLTAYRDENFPVGAIQIDGTYHVYYTGQNGGDAGWSLQMISSTDPTNFGSSRRKVSGPGDGKTKGQQGGLIRLSKDRVLFLSRGSADLGPIEIRTAPVSDLTNLTRIEDTWDWGDEVSEPKLFLDREAEEWLLFYRGPIPSNGSSSDRPIKLMTAPVSYDQAASVELTSFSVKPLSGAAELAWETASEFGNAGFYIQRRSSNESWLDIGFVEGAGTATVLRSYHYKDDDLPLESYRIGYRLRQVDLDGDFHYSDSISIEFQGFVSIEGNTPNDPELFEPYPNPALNTTTISFVTRQVQDISVAIYDMLGRRRSIRYFNRLPSGKHVKLVDVSQLESGAYSVQLKVDGTMYTKGLVVIK